MYLPKDATIEQSCAWLEAKTGEMWILPRLLECHLTPYFWIDFKQGYPIIFGDRIEGYQTRMVFQGDLTRLESDGCVALVTMFTAHDDALVKVEPGWPVPLSDLRFKREEVERVAQIINASKRTDTQPQAAPVPAPVVEAPASEPQPLPLTTGDIAHCFAGLHWDEQQWRKPLGYPPKWLKACVHTPGQQGVSETRWNPVSIGAALIRDGHANANSVRGRFQTNHLLKPWLELWKTYEADYLNEG